MNFRQQILALTAGQPIQVDLRYETHGQLIDTRRGWVPATVKDVNETLNGEINLWATVQYPPGQTGRDGSTEYTVHFTANKLCVQIGA